MGTLAARAAFAARTAAPRAGASSPPTAASTAGWKSITSSAWFWSMLRCSFCVACRARTAGVKPAGAAADRPGLAQRGSRVHAAVHQQVRAGDPGALVAGEEQGGVGDVPGLPDAGYRHPG